MTRTRMTNQRRIILEELRKVRTHPTVDEIYELVRERMPHISLGTVYRNLDLLAEQGEILKLDSVGSMRRYDGETKPHLHVHCRVCGRIGDVETDAPVSFSPAHAKCGGFRIMSVRVEFDGICEQCAAAAAAREAAGKAV